MESFTNSITLRILDLRFRMVDVIDGKKQLIIMRIRFATKLCSAIRQYSQQRYPVIIKKWNNLIVEQVCGMNRNFAGILAKPTAEKLSMDVC